MNTSAASVTVRPTWFQRDSAVEYRPQARILAPNETVTYTLAGFPDMPDGVWSGVFTATGSVAVLVNDINTTQTTGMAYSGFAAGSVNISIPLTFKQSNGWDTGIQVQNLGGIEAIVTVEHFRTDLGARVAVEAQAIPPGDSRTFYQPANTGLQPGHVGSAVITSSNGQPIVAIVNEINYVRGGDEAMTYEGINY